MSIVLWLLIPGPTIIKSLKAECSEICLTDAQFSHFILHKVTSVVHASSTSDISLSHISVCNTEKHCGLLCEANIAHEWWLSGVLHAVDRASMLQRQRGCENVSDRIGQTEGINLNTDLSYTYYIQWHVGIPDIYGGGYRNTIRDVLFYSKCAKCAWKFSSHTQFLINNAHFIHVFSKVSTQATWQRYTNSRTW